MPVDANVDVATVRSLSLAAIISCVQCHTVPLPNWATGPGVARVGLEPTLSADTFNLTLSLSLCCTPTKWETLSFEDVCHQRVTDLLVSDINAVGFLSGELDGALQLGHTLLHLIDLLSGQRTGVVSG